MTATFTPMIHVPDVKATALWYQNIGFSVERWHEKSASETGNDRLEEGSPELDWAMLRFGDGVLMLSAGGRKSNAPRRDVDLYVDLGKDRVEPGIDALFAQLRDRAGVEVVRAPYDAFHGNRELIIRDLNGFWITFAEPVGGR